MTKADKIAARNAELTQHPNTEVERAAGFLRVDGDGDATALESSSVLATQMGGHFVAMSSAVSLKRIADALETIAATATNTGGTIPAPSVEVVLPSIELILPEGTVETFASTGSSIDQLVKEMRAANKPATAAKTKASTDTPAA